MCYLVHFKSKIIILYKRQNTNKIDEIHEILTFKDKNTINIDKIHIANLEFQHKNKPYEIKKAS